MGPKLAKRRLVDLQLCLPPLTFLFFNVAAFHAPVPLFEGIFPAVFVIEPL